jgi:hypothetical protein
VITVDSGGIPIDHQSVGGRAIVPIITRFG